MMIHDKKLKKKEILLTFQHKTTVFIRYFTRFLRNVMQKKLLSLLMLASCGINYGEEVRAITIDEVLMKLKNESPKAEIGSLGEHVKGIDPQEFLERFLAIKQEYGLLQRIARELNIDKYREQSKREYEKALVEEFSSNPNAIEALFEAKKKANEDEDADHSKMISDHSWYCGIYYGPTVKSMAGFEISQKDAEKKVKDNISSSDKDLVAKSKYDIIDVLSKDIANKIYELESRYLKGLATCGGDTDCLAKRKINWQEVQNPEFFAEFCAETHVVAVRFAQEKGITISLEDMQRVAQSNLRTMAQYAKLHDLKKNAENKVRTILNPEPEHKEPIDLTGEEKPEIKLSLLDDSKEDQNNQGSLSE